MNRIERVFHPVGQGAFYSEHFYVPDKQYNVVYDCGTSSASQSSKAVVKQSFSEDETIDILFISHLDWDHISLIPTLRKSVKNIKHVVLPHVGDDYQMLFLINHPKIPKDLINTVRDIITSPKDYFGPETKVWRISPVEEEREPKSDQGILDLDEADTQNNILLSGQKLSLTKIRDWCYIPFNYYSSRKFREVLQEKLCVDKDFQKNFKALLGVDHDISIENALEALRDPEKVTDIIKNQSVKKKKEKTVLDVLKEIYNQLEGKINAHSLVLYSGPQSNAYYFYYDILWQNYRLYKRFYRDCFLPFFCFDKIHHKLIEWRVACIYNGDSNYNEHELKQRLRRVWDNVGTIQVAHHGSKGSHDFNCEGDNFFLCPISYGTKNTYGHPSSKVLKDLVVKNRIPISITEDLGSGFIQIISWNS